MASCRRMPHSPMAEPVLGERLFHLSVDQLHDPLDPLDCSLDVEVDRPEAPTPRSRASDRRDRSGRFFAMVGLCSKFLLTSNYLYRRLSTSSSSMSRISTEGRPRMQPMDAGTRALLTTEHVAQLARSRKGARAWPRQLRRRTRSSRSRTSSPAPSTTVVSLSTSAATSASEDSGCAPTGRWATGT